MQNIIFLNHKQQQCGVYQYGYRTAMILKQSKKYNFMYFEVDNETDFNNAVKACSPAAIIYNYHPSTMGWLNRGVLSNNTSVKHYGIHHEGNDTIGVGFDNFVITDCSFTDTDNMFSVPRPLFENFTIDTIAPVVPTIGSFGFGFHNKGFERLVKLVNEQFDQANIRLHIPFAYYGDMHGNSAHEIVRLCKSHITKEGISLSVTHDFLTDNELLYFLNGNTLNAFLYDEMPGRGLSSVIDYAISTDVPIAITATYMFRHLSKSFPSICIEQSSLKDILSSGIGVNKVYRDMWSNANLIGKYELILNKTIL